MKVKLINSGGFFGMDEVCFPVIVSGRKAAGFYIPTSELLRIGCDMECFTGREEYCFVPGWHALEVVSEE